MRSRRPDFAAPRIGCEEWYDIYEDWDLIEASFAAQYGIRLRAESDMSWGEFCTLLAGIMPETPLGQIVSIRSEKNRETLKHFTKEQHRIRNEWRSRQARLVLTNKEEAGRQVRAFQEMCRRAFGSR